MNPFTSMACTLEKSNYTLRDRDTTEQKRLSEEELIKFFEQQLA